MREKPKVQKKIMTCLALKIAWIVEQDFSRLIRSMARKTL